MKVRFTKGALREYDDVLSYIGARSRGGEQRVKRRIDALIRRLKRFPGIGTRTDDKGIRCS